MRKENGFTLVELVVVAVLLAFLATLLFGSMRGIIRTREVTERSTKVLRIASSIIQKMTEELSSRASVPVRDKAEGAEVGQIRNRARYLQGFHFQEGEADKDLLRFTSRGKAQANFGSSANFGDVQIEYRLDDSEQRFSSGSVRRYVLIREESPASTDDKELVKKKRVQLALTDNIASLRFRYLKQRNTQLSWQREWTGSDLRHPNAIEITLSLVDEDEQIHTFRTAVTLAEPRTSQLGFRSIGGA